MSKHKTIKLFGGTAPGARESYASEAEWHAARRFRVVLITDSLEFGIGQLLDRAEVQKLCDSDEWSVTIMTGKLANG